MEAWMARVRGSWWRALARRLLRRRRDEPPALAERPLGALLHDGVVWSGWLRASGTVEVHGPYCPADGEALRFGGAGPLPARGGAPDDNHHVRPKSGGRLHCPACGAAHYLGATPWQGRRLGDTRAAARRAFERGPAARERAMLLEQRAA
jgi:hypothetical protein